MAQRKRPAEKKRYMLSLTRVNVERFQSACQRGGLPPATMSHAVDDFIKQTADVMEKLIRTGVFTVQDYFKMAAEQMDLTGEEVIQDEKSPPKAENVERKPRTKKQIVKLVELIRKS